MSVKKYLASFVQRREPFYHPSPLEIVKINDWLREGSRASRCVPLFHEAYSFFAARGRAELRGLPKNRKQKKKKKDEDEDVEEKRMKPFKTNIALWHNAYIV